MSRIVFGKVGNRSQLNGEAVTFSLLVSSILVSQTVITAPMGDDGKFCVLLPSGQYSVSISNESVTQGLGTITVTDGDMPIDLVDLLNTTDGGNREPSGNTTLYIIPRTLDAINAPIAPVNMASQRLINMATPVDNGDGANKKYVDDAIRPLELQKYVFRIIEDIDIEVRNKQQVFDKYKDTKVSILVALDFAYEIFPEWNLPIGLGALVEIVPTISGTTVTLSYNKVSEYYHSLVVLKKVGNTIHAWDSIQAGWVNVTLPRTTADTLLFNKINKIESLLGRTLEYLDSDEFNEEQKVAINELKAQLAVANEKIASFELLFTHDDDVVVGEDNEKEEEKNNE